MTFQLSQPEDPQEVLRLIEQSGCPVARAVLELHQPEYPPEGKKWMGEDGKKPHCTGCSTGDPFLDPTWPCQTVDTVVETIKKGH